MRHRRAAAAVVPLLVAAALVAPRVASAARQGRPEVSSLVRRCVEAYGGKASLARSAYVREDGTVTSRILHPGEAGRFARAYARSGRLRVEIAYPNAPGEVRVLDGGRGWRFGEEVSGPSLSAMILQAARMDLPSMLASWEANLKDRGTVAHEGKTLRVLALEIAPGLVVEAAIDPASGRILRSRGASEAGPPIEFVTTYSDFRKVEGVLVAFREGNWANGATTGETVLTRVEFPKGLPAETFRP